MSASLRILFIASRYPYPPIQGDRVRAYHQIRCLARRHRVALVTPAPDDAGARGAIESLCERVIEVRVGRFERARNLLGAPLSPLPWQTSYWLRRPI